MDAAAHKLSRYQILSCLPDKGRWDGHVHRSNPMQSQGTV